MSSGQMAERARLLRELELPIGEPWILHLMEPENVRDTMRSITAGLKVEVSEEEGEVRLHATELLKDDLRQFDVASNGVVVGPQ